MIYAALYYTYIVIYKHIYKRLYMIGDPLKQISYATRLVSRDDEDNTRLTAIKFCRNNRFPLLYTINHLYLFISWTSYQSNFTSTYPV